MAGGLREAADNRRPAILAACVVEWRAHPTDARSIPTTESSAEFGATPRDSATLAWAIAQAQAMAGDNRGALATARRTASERGRDAVPADLCEVQCWENNVREAIATALEIASAGSRSEALVEIARHRVRGGDIAGAAQPIALAVEAAEAITDAAGRARALARIAGIQLDSITD